MAKPGPGTPIINPGSKSPTPSNGGWSKPKGKGK